MTRLLGQILLGTIIIIGGFALSSQMATNPLLAILLGSGLIGAVFAIGQSPDEDESKSLAAMDSLHF
jgi:nitrate/nitrite transporter NarK